jgi:hypothetical protein
MHFLSSSRYFLSLNSKYSLSNTFYLRSSLNVTHQGPSVVLEPFYSNLVEYCTLDCPGSKQQVEHKQDQLTAPRQVRSMYEWTQLSCQLHVK